MMTSLLATGAQDVYGAVEDFGSVCDGRQMLDEIVLFAEYSRAEIALETLGSLVVATG